MFRAAAGAPFLRASSEALAGSGLRLESLTTREAASRYPQIRFEGVESVLLEPDAGYLRSRRACRHVAERFVAAGGAYRCQAAVSPAVIAGSPARAIGLVNGDTLRADVFVFACGPWLGTLLPDVIGALIAVTKQDVFYFGVPAADDRFSDARLPVWIDFGERFVYGIPAAGGAFKFADDTPGPAFDPTSGERRGDDEGVARARAFLADRFPAMAAAPLVATEVCQYESTPDANFIVDRHPAFDNVWIAGGGSGHGFKMGPAVGEALARCILDGATPEPAFSLRRFAATPAGGWKAKWA
jgi:glycine/D-amino acid oxidase-like deaminating enzyme